MIKKYPGFIDIHVHLREPGATHKEDFFTGSKAAVKGGFTFIVDMPNNPQPTISLSRLKEKEKLSKKKAVCEIGFHYGTNGLNTESFKQASKDTKVFGLKLYCNHTTGEMLLEDLPLLEKVFQNWTSTKPILVHAEGVELAAAIALAQLYGRRLHVCHIAKEEEVELVERAKKQGIKITAGVCPHHLWLTEKDLKKLGSLAMMKPPLGNKNDQKALWQALNNGVIDIVETDHAPHTLAEKNGKKPAFGVPGLETAVSLIIKGIKDGFLTKRSLVDVLYDSPKKIFNIPEQKNTFVEIDEDESWTVGKSYAGKCDWSPFAGWKLPGVVKKVVIKDKVVF